MTSGVATFRLEHAETLGIRWLMGDERALREGAPLEARLMGGEANVLRDRLYAAIHKGG